MLIGPHTFNFLQATKDAIAAGAARRITNAEDLLATANALLNDQAAMQAMRQASRDFATAHQGATERTLQLLLALNAPAPDQAKH